MAVIGIGTTSRATVEDVLSVISAAKEKCAVVNSAHEMRQITALAGLDRAALNAVLAEAAQTTKLELILLGLDDLRAAAHLCVTSSQKSIQQYGIPSIAEAAALSGAGDGAKLLLPRICGRRTTASVAIAP
ncbi:MAG: cobalamin biosynthesis protein [Rhodomicrobium sp.]